MIFGETILKINFMYGRFEYDRKTDIDIIPGVTVRRTERCAAVRMWEEILFQSYNEKGSFLRNDPCFELWVNIFVFVSGVLMMLDDPTIHHENGIFADVC